MQSMRYLRVRNAMDVLASRADAILARPGPDDADELRRLVQRLRGEPHAAGSGSGGGGSSTVWDSLLGGALPPFEHFLPSGWAQPALRKLEPQMLVRGRVVSVRSTGAVVLLQRAWPRGTLPNGSAEAAGRVQLRPMDRLDAQGTMHRGSSASGERAAASSAGTASTATPSRGIPLELERAQMVALLHGSRVVPEGTLLADGCEAALRQRVCEGDEITAIVLAVHAPQRRVALSLRPTDCTADPRARALLGCARARPAAGSGGDGKEAADAAARRLPDDAMELWPTLNERLLAAPLLWQPEAERAARTALGVPERGTCMVRARRPLVHRLLRDDDLSTTGSGAGAEGADGGGGGGGGGGDGGGGGGPSLEQIRLEQNRTWAAEAVARGVAHAKAHREDEAFVAYRQALELDPSCCDAHVARGAAHANGSRLLEAMHDFERALQLRADERNALRYLHATVTRMTPAQRAAVPPHLRSLLQAHVAANKAAAAAAAAAEAGVGSAAAASAADAAAVDGGVQSEVARMPSSAAVARPSDAALPAPRSPPSRSSTGANESGPRSSGGHGGGAAPNDRARALEGMVEALRKREKKEKKSKKERRKKEKKDKKERRRCEKERREKERRRSSHGEADEGSSKKRKRSLAGSESSSSSSDEEQEGPS